MKLHIKIDAIMIMAMYENHYSDWLTLRVCPFVRFSCQEHYSKTLRRSAMNKNLYCVRLRFNNIPCYFFVFSITRKKRIEKFS